MTTVDAIADVTLGEISPLDIFAGDTLIIAKGEKFRLSKIRVMAEAWENGTLVMPFPAAIRRIQERLSS